MHTEIKEINTEMQYQAVGKTEDFVNGKGKRVIVNGRNIAIWRVNDDFYAIDDACSHMQASLSFGSVNDRIVACPRHGAQFDLISGKVVSLPATHGVNAYEVKIIDGDVMVCLTPKNPEKPDILRLP